MLKIKSLVKSVSSRKLNKLNDKGPSKILFLRTSSVPFHYSNSNAVPAINANDMYFVEAPKGLVIKKGRDQIIYSGVLVRLKFSEYNDIRKILLNIRSMVEILWSTRVCLLM